MGKAKPPNSYPRQTSPNLGDNTTEFVRKAYEHTGLHPDLVPGFLDREPASVNAAIPHRTFPRDTPLIPRPWSAVSRDSPGGSPGPGMV